MVQLVTDVIDKILKEGHGSDTNKGRSTLWYFDGKDLESEERSALQEAGIFMKPLEDDRGAPYGGMECPIEFDLVQLLHRASPNFKRSHNSQAIQALVGNQDNSHSYTYFNALNFQEKLLSLLAQIQKVRTEEKVDGITIEFPVFSDSAGISSPPTVKVTGAFLKKMRLNQQEIDLLQQDNILRSSKKPLSQDEASLYTVGVDQLEIRAGASMRNSGEILANLRKTLETLNVA